MAYRLTEPPTDERERELWLQHAAGFIIFKDMRNYAISRIPNNTDDDTKKTIIKGIDDAVYGLMMIMDGVTGELKNENYNVSIESIVKLEKHGNLVQEINIFNGDGMCMGFHGWKENDFGRNPPVESIES